MANDRRTLGRSPALQGLSVSDNLQIYFRLRGKEASPAALLGQSRGQQKSFVFLLPARRSPRLAEAFGEAQIGAGGEEKNRESIIWCSILELVRTHFAACGGKKPPREFGAASPRDLTISNFSLAAIQEVAKRTLLNKFKGRENFISVLL